MLKVVTQFISVLLDLFAVQLLKPLKDLVHHQLLL